MINPKKRFEVLKRDKFRCQYCGREGKDVTLEVDHVTPKSKGGSDELNNLITCCRECNMGKGSEELDGWDSVFNVKCDDIYNRIKKYFYNDWNDLIDFYRKEKGKYIDSTLDRKTSGLLASFLSWWVNEELKNKDNVRDRILRSLNFELKTAEGFGLDPDSLGSVCPSLYELYKDGSLLNEKIEEFFRGGKIFDEVTWNIAGDFLSRDCYVLEDIFDDDLDWKRKLESVSDRLNYNITVCVKKSEAPSRILRKYSLFPDAGEECTEE